MWNALLRLIIKSPSSVTGFSTGELDVILNGSTDPDDAVIPEVPASPQTRLSDIWLPPISPCSVGQECGKPRTTIRGFFVISPRRSGFGLLFHWAISRRASWRATAPSAF
jgi:hypothetical protein